MPVLLGCGQMGHAAICRKYPSKVKFKERCNHHTESILKGTYIYLVEEQKQKQNKLKNKKIGNNNY